MADDKPTILMESIAHHSYLSQVRPVGSTYLVTSDETQSAEQYADTLTALHFAKRATGKPAAVVEVVKPAPAAVAAPAPVTRTAVAAPTHVAAPVPLSPTTPAHATVHPAVTPAPAAPASEPSRAPRRERGEGKSSSS